MEQPTVPQTNEENVVECDDAWLPDTVYVYGMPLTHRGWTGAYKKQVEEDRVLYRLVHDSYYGIPIRCTVFEKNYEGGQWKFYCADNMESPFANFEGETNTDLLGSWGPFYVTAKKAWLHLF